MMDGVMAAVPDKVRQGRSNREQGEFVGWTDTVWRVLCTGEDLCSVHIVHHAIKKLAS
jgi:hypothetical protein